jgi:hypothetical protein
MAMKSAAYCRVAEHDTFYQGRGNRGSAFKISKESFVAFPYTGVMARLRGGIAHLPQLSRFRTTSI